MKMRIGESWNNSQLCYSLFYYSLCSPCPNFLASIFLVYPVRKLVSPKKTQFCFKTNLNLSRQYSEPQSHFTWSLPMKLRMIHCPELQNLGFLQFYMFGTSFTLYNSLHLYKQDYNTLSFLGFSATSIQCLIFALQHYISFLAYYSHYIFYHIFILSLTQDNNLINFSIGHISLSPVLGTTGMRCL